MTAVNVANNHANADEFDRHNSRMHADRIAYHGA